MNILTFNEIYYEKESKHISSSSYNIDAYDIKRNSHPHIIFDHSKFLEFDYYQKWDNTSDGSIFFEIPYEEVNSYSLILSTLPENMCIGTFVDDTLGKYLVVNSLYLDLISNNLESICTQILDIFVKYKVKEKINPCDYKVISLDEYNSKIKKARKLQIYNHNLIL